MLARLITATRCIHSTKQRFIKFNFSDVETEKLLSVVNSSSVQDLTDRFGISTTTATKLHIGCQRISKNVDSIDALLSIDGFSENVLNKFCKQILNEGDANKKESNEYPKKSKFRFLSTPPIPLNVIREINSFTSIQCGLVGLAWCTFEITPNEMTKITHWGWRPLPEKKLNLYRLGAFMASTLQEVPQSDFYVFEDPVITQVGPAPKVKLNVQIAQMIGMASVSFAQRSTLPIVEDEYDSINNVAYLRKFLYARLFQLYIGKERVSSVECVEKFIRMSNISGVMQDNVQTFARVDDDLKRMYLTSENHVKDFLSCSLLIGLTFLRLNILKCSESLQLVAK